MRFNILIIFIIFYVIIECYSELIGLFIDIINDMLVDGCFICYWLCKDKKCEKVMINIVVMIVDVFLECNLNFN